MTKMSQRKRKLSLGEDEEGNRAIAPLRQNFQKHNNFARPRKIVQQQFLLPKNINSLRPRVKLLLKFYEVLNSSDESSIFQVLKYVLSVS